MASACDIPRLVQCVLCTKTLLRWLLRDFDGYSDGPSTKGVEKERRAMKVQSSDIHFAEDMPVTVCQERFFKKNKAKFIRALADHMERAGIQVK